MRGLRAFNGADAFRDQRPLHSADKAIKFSETPLRSFLSYHFGLTLTFGFFVLDPIEIRARYGLDKIWIRPGSHSQLSFGHDWL